MGYQILCPGKMMSHSSQLVRSFQPHASTAGRFPTFLRPLVLATRHSGYVYWLIET